MQTKKKIQFKKVSLWVRICVAALALGIGFTVWQSPPDANLNVTTPTEPPSPLLDNPYRPESFAYEGSYMTCLEGTSMLGVDVSYWQGYIDWQQVKDAGIEFVMIRIGWRGSNEGGLHEDEYAQQNYLNAKAAGLKIGGYFFSQAVSPEEAIEEANFVAEITKSWYFDMPVAYDWEYQGDNSRTVGMDVETLTSCASAFCDVLEGRGYDTMVYFNPNYAKNRLDLEKLAKYDFWLAMYNDSMDFPYRVNMWQYTDQGAVPGIRGSVDLNLYLTYEDP